MATLTIKSVGNSAGVLLPKEILTKLRVEKGDVLHVIETENGIELTAYDPEFDAQMAIAEDIMREDRRHPAQTCKMTEPIWINLRVIKAFHDRQINEHGGLPGLRDEGLLLSALSRPENAYHYSDPKPDIAELAAAYGFGLAKNHPFNDANKRTALIAMRLFLKLNGYDLAASLEDKYKTIIRVAASNMSEDELAQWISNSLEAIKS